MIYEVISRYRDHFEAFQATNASYKKLSTLFRERANKMAVSMFYRTVLNGTKQRHMTVAQSIRTYLLVIYSHHPNSASLFLLDLHPIQWFRFTITKLIVLACCIVVYIYSRERESISSSKYHIFTTDHNKSVQLNLLDDRFKFIKQLIYYKIHVFIIFSYLLKFEFDDILFNCIL